MEDFLKKHKLIVFLILFLLLFLGFLVRYHVIGYGIGSGGNFYYSQLVSLVLDGDLDMFIEAEKDL